MPLKSGQLVNRRELSRRIAAGGRSPSDCSEVRSKALSPQLNRNRHRKAGKVPNFPDVVLWALPAFIVLALIEFFAHRRHADSDHQGYGAKDTFTSVAMGLGSLGLDLAWKIPITAAYSVVYLATPFRVELTWETFVFILLGQDLLYYWSHRSHHVIRILWASHVVHHSSRHFNYSTAVRQSWTGLTAWIFYLPLVGAGVHPAALAFCSSVNLLYQFWIHTERIRALPSAFEFVFNTPSHHRVHHASQGTYLDRNFGGILIIWDRLFGSFTKEDAPCQYGLTKNIQTYNPIRVATHEYVSIARDIRTARTWNERVSYLFRSPGWSAARSPAAGSLRSQSHREGPA